MKKYMERSKKIFGKIMSNRLVMFGASAIFVILAAFYYYGLSCEYAPNGEDIQTISAMFSHLYLGTDWRNMDVLYDVCAFMATKFGGMSYLAIRLFFLFFYIILLCETVFCV